MNFEKQLIQLVRKNDILYNYYHPDYKTLHLRAGAWAKVADELGINVKEVQKRWQNLRRVFRRIRIKIRQTGRLPRSKWRHYDDMEFIREFDPTPGEQNIVDIQKAASEMEQDEKEELLAGFIDDVKMEDYEDGTSSFDPSDEYIDHQSQDSEILHSFVIEHFPAQPITSARFDATELKVEKLNNSNMPSPTRKDHTKKLISTCRQNLYILGAKIDAMKIPHRTKFELERKVAELVYDVLDKYSSDV